MSKMNTLGNKNMQGKTPAFLKDNGSKKQGRGLLGLLLVLVLMACAMPAKLQAQTHPYSGVWYMKSFNNTDYYVVPAADPQVSQAGHVNEDAYFSYNYNTTPGDPEMPFVTTYQTGGDLNSIWIFVPVQGESNYYYIVHAKTGKYVKYQTYLTGDNARRKYVHLETMDTSGDTEKFEITALNTGVKIKPKNNAMCFNVAGGNQPRYNGGTSSPYYSGIIGGMTGTDNNSQFQLVDASSSADLTPFISDVDGLTNTFSITSPAAAFSTIHYTTDGTTTPDVNTGTTVNSGSPIPITGNWTVQAVGVFGNFVTPLAGPKNLSPAPCPTPVITVSNNVATITCPLAEASIYYTTDGTPATTSSTLYEDSFSAVGVEVIRAIATHTGFLQSNEAVFAPPITVHSSSDIVAMNRSYVLASDFNLTASIGTAEAPFTGVIDGQLNTFSGFTNSLVAYANGAVIKNVILKNVSISGSGNVGAICNEAKGYTRIYNCGILPTNADFSETTRSSVVSTGSGSAGGLVGLLDNDSRVVNCFSYADVSSTGFAAGIVGNNTFASTAEVSDDKYYKLRTMVVNCMFYGDITAGSNVWPVYGGEKIINGGGSGDDISDGLYAINNYNFYSDSCSFPAGKEPSATHIYNCSWPAKYEYLTRYEFHRYLLNSNRELCGWWVGAPIAPSAMSTTDVQNVPKDASLMAKWVLDRSVAPFPILKPFGTYPSPINIDADATWRESANEWEGKQLGTLSVTVNPGDHAPSGVTTTTTPLEITITDMDTLHGDFGYRKIQLPYYNTVFGNANGTSWVAKYGGNYGEYAVTGWEITKVNGSSTGTGDYVADWQDGYNFADRKSTKKDLYGVSGRIFAQGGYYYVPDDVTTIEIKAHWGKAVYLGNGDNYYDRVDFDYLAQLVNNGAVLHRENRPGTAFEPAGTRSSTLGNGHTIRTGKIADVATNYIASGGTVFDNALVLVGNHQYCTGDEDVAPDRRFTIMSADFDLDNEPDYCLDWQLGVGTTRQTICPIRFDFLPVVEIGLGLKKDGSTQYYSLGCYRPKGHFEVTETALIRFGQFEFSNVRNVESPIILNGGIFDQYVKGTQGASNASNDKITYVIIGGNLKMLSFTPGAHVNSNATYSTRHCAVNAIGGRFESLYLSGNFNEAVTPNTDNPHCYIDGGWFGHVAAAGKEGIDGDVTFKINHAVIHEFYGGGIMSGHEVTGSIDVTVDNSLVNKYCGGPKFGNMTTGKTVTTRATGTTFGVYYGAGNGGTNYVQYQRTDGTFDNSNGYNWNSSGQLNGYIPGTYRDLATGYQADYDMELINVSTGSYYDCAVNRTYFYAAQYSATNTGTVTNTLTDCTVKTNFYGAGNLGGVNGNVTSTLTDTKVRGSAFGGGFSASIPKVTIYNKDKQVPVIDLYTGSITPQSGGTSTTYTWSNDASLSTGSPIGDGIFFTEVPLTNLGTVSGDVTLTIQGESVIGTSADGSTGNVFGGGDESAVTGSTLVKILGRTKVFGNIYGGGNMGNVGVDTKVIVNGQSN